MNEKRYKVYWENTDGSTGESGRTYTDATECVELLDSLCRAGARVWFKEEAKATPDPNRLKACKWGKCNGEYRGNGPCNRCGSVFS